MEEICLWLPIALITCRSGISIRKKRLFRDYSQKAESTLSCFLKRVENTLIPPIEVACIAFTWGTSMMLRIYGMDYSYYIQTNVRQDDSKTVKSNIAIE